MGASAVNCLIELAHFGNLNIKSKKKSLKKKKKKIN